MPLYENTLAELVERVVRMGIGTWKAGTCTGGTTATFIDTIRRNEKDDFFNSTIPVSRVRIVTSTDGLAPQGEEREITDWVQSTATGTVGVAFSAAPASGDKYAILSDVYWDEVVNAINDAIDLVAGECFIDAIDETMTFQSDVYEYPVPSGFIYLYRITQENSDGQFLYPLKHDEWTVRRGMNPPRIKLYLTDTSRAAEGHYLGDLFADDSLEAGYHVRLEGLKRQARLVADSDICYLNPVFIAHQAAAWLHAKYIRRNENDPDMHGSQYQIQQAIADGIRKDMRTQLPPDSKRVM